MTELNTQMSGESLAIAEQRKQELKQLFPGVFTEIKNDKGEIVEAIDYERLKAELGNFSEVYDNRRERYGMDWPGKRDCLRLIQEPSRATLKPCRDESVEFDNTENLFIEGDNLEVLKLLQKAYYSKVKMIYIDPPYNTGKEFIYPDNFSESLETYLSYAGLSGDDGKKFSTNSANEGRFHTKWLNMMFPRLYLARNLLRDDGVIFISIDDNEVENLRRMCDEIFGEENHVETFVWKKSYGGGPKEKYAVTQHEYVLMYSRFKESLSPIFLSYDPEKVSRYYRHSDEKVDIRGPYRLKPLEATKSMDARPNLMYSVLNADGFEVWPKRQWLWGKERVLKALENNEVIFVTSENGTTLNYKQYLRDEDSNERGEKPFSVIDGIYTQHGTDEIRKIFSDKVVIQYPKPTDLISKFIEIGCSSECSEIVMDFFAGSGSTAHASMRSNINKKLKSKFVLVQLPELCEVDSVAFNDGFKTIADICKERIRRVIDKMKDELSSELDLNDSSLLDLGIKVLKLDRSNFKHWQAPIKDITDDELAKQFELHIDHIDPNASQEDILYELLIKAGVMPTEKIELIELANHAVFSVGEGGWLICLQDTIEQSLIDAVLEKEPVQFICLDRAFHGNDQLKANAIATFADFNQGRDKAVQIEFRTV